MLACALFLQSCSGDVVVVRVVVSFSVGNYNKAFPLDLSPLVSALSAGMRGTATTELPG